MNTACKLALMTSIALALSFTLSCSSDDGDDKKSNGANQSSSSAVSVSSSSATAIEYDSLNYGGHTYKTVKIGSQVWMAENLNYGADGKCYDDSQANCEKNGKLYDWESAKSACPSGWHLPAKDEFDILKNYIEADKNCSGCAAKYLISAASDWDSNIEGENAYGFAALPGGFGALDLDADFFFSMDIGYSGNWWSATNCDDAPTEHGAFAYGWQIDSQGYFELTPFNQSAFLSVRCVKEAE